MSAISNYFQTKLAIQKFQTLAQTEDKTQNLQNLLNQIGIGAKQTVMTLRNDVVLYRCRRHEKGSLFGHVKDLQYPPPDKVTQRGRFNDVGESIYYCSNTELGTLVEMNPNLETIFTMAVVHQKASAPQPLIMEFRDADNNADFLSAQHHHLSARERLVKSFFLSELSCPRSERGYLATIAIGRHYFTKEPVGKDERGLIAPYPGHKSFAITYPSVQAPLYTNAQTYNIAMLPATFDECFETIGAEVYSLTYDEIKHHVRLTSHNTASVASDGLLQWKFSYQQMVERAALGIHGNNISDEKLKIAAQYL